MSDKRQPEHNESLNVGDIYYVLFRQKWIILAFSVLGFVAAAVVCVIKPPLYESQAKIYIQYLLGVNRENSDPGNASSKYTPDESGYSIIQNELDIMTSLDVVQKVVTDIGADRILAAYGGGEDTNAAASVVLGNLIKDEVPKTTSSLRVAFQHPDKDVSRDVLRSVIENYRSKSAEVHIVEVPEEMLTNDVEELRQEEAQAVAKLSKAKQEAGIIYTLEDTKQNLSQQVQERTSELRDAQVEFASIGGSAKAPEKGSAISNAPETPAKATQEIPAEVKMDYQATQEALHRAMEAFVQAKVADPDGSPLLEKAHQLVVEKTQALNKIESDYPQIKSSGIVATTQGSPGPDDVVGQAVSANRLEMKITALQGQLAQLKADQTLLESKEPEISLLQHAVDFKSAQLKRYSDHLQQASNSSHQEFSGGIKIIEKPTPAVRRRSKTAKKLMMGALAGGVLAGLGLAFLIELVLDRSVKRPADIESKLRLPLFISIPDVNGNSHPKVAALPDKNRVLLSENNTTALVAANGTDGKGEAEEVGPWDPRHSLHRFYAGLRDRLIVNFEVRNLTHNPKLVGVTSCNKGAGVSTVAAGLAASLSETGDGNVLLVDMRGQDGGARQFYKGKPALGIDAALGTDTKAGARVHEHLYAASEGVHEGEIPAALSKRFATLMPKLKASDYDYIVFDMPPVSQTSMTARLSGLMDMVLLVIESEKSNRDSVKRATALLKESKAHVSTVLNKVHTYVPTKLHQEFLDDEA